MALMRVTLGTINTLFEVENELDHIQRFHVNGQFYEVNQLLAQRNLIQRQVTVIDIGANVGNHTLFYGQHTDAAKVYPIEANPAAASILAKSVELNQRAAKKIDLRYNFCAVGSRRGRVRLVSSPPNNLGGTTFGEPEETGEIECFRLDDLKFEGRIGLIKIDVERTEMDVLKGAEATIARARPVLAIEVVQANEQKFWEWIQAHRYHVINAFFDYINVKNYHCIPMG